ncbi:MAG: glycosyltransferase family 39 protein [Armatimonadetes bacterium]|nr:glycosyltransferase family 39 protein [Armatimonadota bacterium]
MSRIAWVAAWAFAFLLLSGFWTYGLFDLDEGIYAAALREMLERGDWVAISYRGEPFFEKPILIYWSAMLFLKAGVPDVLALRLGPVLATAGTLLITTAFARRRFGDEVGLWSLLILACSPLLVLVGRMFQPDAMLLFFLTAALVSFWEAVQGNGRWLWAGGAALGFAVLAKGPVALALFLPVAAYALIRLRAPTRPSALDWAGATVLFLLVVGSWYVPVLVLKGGDFFREFIVEQNLLRFAGGDTAHLGPFWFYVPVLLAALAPFAFAVVGAVRHVRKEPVEAFLWAWAVVVFLLFSAAGSKLPHYILPLLPPLAVLLAVYGVRHRAAIRFWSGAYGLVAGAGLLLAAWNGVEPGGALYAVGGAAVGGGALSLALGATGRSFLAQGLAAAAPLAAAVALIGVPLYWTQTHWDVRRVARDAAAEPLPVVEYRMSGMGRRMLTSHPSIQWYAGRSTEPAVWLDDLARRLETPFQVVSRRGRLGPDEVRILRGLGLKLELVSERGEFSLYVARR